MVDMRKIFTIALGYIVICSLTNYAIAEPELTSLQRRVMESKELEGTFDDTFKSTVAVLQDRVILECCGLSSQDSSKILASK